jgi:hypothetical protein
MLHDIVAFKSYACFDFKNLSIYDQYMYYYWPTPNLSFNNFLVVSKSVLTQYDRTCPPPLLDISSQTYLETTKSIFTRLVWPLSWTYPVHRTYLAS